MSWRSFRYESPDSDAGGAAAAASAAPAAPAADAAAAPAPASGAPDNLVAAAKPPVAGTQPVSEGATKETPAAAPTVDQMREALAKSGQKSEEIAKLDDAALKAAYDKSQLPTYAAFKMPEGVKLDDKALPEITNAFGKFGLSQEQAQGLIDALGGKLVPAEALKAQQEASYKAWWDTQAQWQSAVKADPEIGGNNFDRTMTTIASGIDALTSTPAEAKAIRQAFELTGAGNNPEVIRFLYRALEPYAEGDFASDGKPASTAAVSAAEKLYPSQGGAS